MGGRCRSRFARCGRDVLDPDVAHVPLGEDDDRRALGLARRVRDGQVLVDDTLARVHEHERDVGALRSLERPQLGVVLDSLPLLALASETGGVHEHERGLAAAKHGVDRVPGGAGNLGDDHALAPEQRVQERRLPHVRTTEDRNPDRLLADGSLALSGEPRDDVVQEVAGAVTVQRGERDRVAEAEPVELQRLRVAARDRRACSRSRARHAGTSAGSPRAPRHRA